MPSESVVGGVQLAVALVNFGCLVLNLKLALAIGQLRTEVMKMFAEHVRDYHPSLKQQARSAR